MKMETLKNLLFIFNYVQCVTIATVSDDSTNKYIRRLIGLRERDRLNNRAGSTFYPKGYQNNI